MNPLLAAAIETLDLADTPEPLTEHHTLAWRVGDWKIKAATEPVPAANLLHEIRVVDRLHAQGLHPAAGASGRVGDGVWTALPWCAGTTLWMWCLPTREGRAAPDAGPRLRAITHRAFDALHALHAAGWHHGDIQPTNILVGDDETSIAFIDHDLAQHADLAPTVPYRGGMDQPTAPEIARRILDTPPDTHIELTDAAEQYSLAAAIRWAWTGSPPATTRAIGPGVTVTDLYEDIATGRRRPTWTDTRPWPEPELEALLDTRMSLDPATRAVNAPTA
ncbi:hypothetical protein [Embleya sp. MST-111070]|uniref:hypothetical protein n=1 Tax=Embleya sp. MST-111070 TaxID=3398231 RepID=UPI003F73D973